MCNVTMEERKRTKRKIEDMRMLSRPELLLAINKIDSPRDQALATFLYLTGMRISELVGSKKVVKIYYGAGKDKVVREEKKLTVEALRKESVEILPEKDLILIHQVACLKKRAGIPRRTIPIKISSDKEFIDIFMRYFDSLPAGSKLFDINRHRAWQIINKEMGLYNHFLIHERCTHLVTNKGFTDLDLKQFRGWTDTKPASVYTHLKWQDIAGKM